MMEGRTSEVTGPERGREEEILRTEAGNGPWGKAGLEVQVAAERRAVQGAGGSVEILGLLQFSRLKKIILPALS